MMLKHKVKIQKKLKKIMLFDHYNRRQNALMKFCICWKRFKDSITMNRFSEICVILSSLKEETRRLGKTGTYTITQLMHEVQSKLVQHLARISTN